MRLIEGIHAADSQIYALQRLARDLGITEAGKAIHCGQYGYGATRWCELRWQDAEDIENGLGRIAYHEMLAGGETDLPRSRFWEGPV